MKFELIVRRASGVHHRNLVEFCVGGEGVLNYEKTVALCYRRNASKTFFPLVSFISQRAGMKSC